MPNPAGVSAPVSDIPTVTFGAGQNNIHAIGEYVELADYLNGCRLALALATQEY